MRRLEPRLLWLGNAGDLRKLSAFWDADIRAVVDLAANEPFPQLPRELVYCRFPLFEGSGNDPALLRLAIDTVAERLKSGIRAAVCCSNGLSRYRAIAAAAIGIHDAIPLDEALICAALSGKHDVTPALWNEIKAACRPE